MEQYELEIIQALQQKKDPIAIAKKYNIKLSVVIQIMQKNPELVPKRYQAILGIEDRIEQVKELMRLRKKVASRVPFNNIVAKLRIYLKKPHSSYECLQHVKQPYNRLYAALKKIKVVRANPLSPLSIDLLLSKKAAKRIDILKWRKDQIDKLFRAHHVALRKVEKLDERPAIEEFSLYRLIGLNVYTDNLFFIDYLSFVSPIDYFIASVDKTVARFTNYQKEILLGIVLRRKYVDFLGFPKDSSYYSDSPYYPLFLLNNRSADFELLGIGQDMGWIDVVEELKKKMRLEILIEEALDPQIRQKAAISMDHLVKKFSPELPSIVKDLCWHKTPIFMELIKYIAFYKNQYHPPDMFDLVMNKDILKGCTSLRESEIFVYVYNQMKLMFLTGIMQFPEYTFNDIVEALFFNADRYPFAFYLLARLAGIPTFYKDSSFFLKRMKARKPTVYERLILGCNEET